MTVDPKVICMAFLYVLSNVQDEFCHGKFCIIFMCILQFAEPIVDSFVTFSVTPEVESSFELSVTEKLLSACTWNTALNMECIKWLCKGMVDSETEGPISRKRQCAVKAFSRRLCKMKRCLLTLGCVFSLSCLFTLSCLPSLAACLPSAICRP
jgi:hypothetical protein